MNTSESGLTFMSRLELRLSHDYHMHFLKAALSMISLSFLTERIILVKKLKQNLDPSQDLYA